MNGLMPGIHAFSKNVGTIEIDKQSQGCMCQFHVGFQLGMVHREQSFHSLDLNDETFVYNQIRPETGLKSKRIVCKRNIDFFFNR